MKLSVIIPIYNAEAYIDKCIESLMQQNYPDMQIILVDDGSYDHSAEKCEQWAMKDKRIEVIHKVNGGLSDARNCGIEHAVGELITFVDADDFLAQETYHDVIADMTPDTDIIEFPVFRFYGSQRQEKLQLTPHTYTSAYSYWVKGKAFNHAYAWNKIYRKEMFQKVRFPKGKVFEDAFTLPQLIDSNRQGHCVQVATTDKGMYYYCARNNSITAQADGNDLLMLLTAHLQNPYLMKDTDYYLHVLNIQMDVCEQTGMEPLLKEMRIWDFQGLRFKQIIKALLLNILGINNLCYITQTMHKIRKCH